MSDYTPSAKDFIRIYGVDGIGVENQANVNRARRGIAKIKADALREAAETFDARLPDGTGNGRAYNSYRVAELLKARANEIEAEA